MLKVATILEKLFDWNSMIGSFGHIFPLTESLVRHQSVKTALLGVKSDLLQLELIQTDSSAWRGTQALTVVTVETGRKMGWKASAKSHKLDLLPVQRSEYLGMDVIAFEDGEKRWRFPAAVMELENCFRVDQASAEADQ